MIAACDEAPSCPEEVACPATAWRCNCDAEGALVSADFRPTGRVTGVDWDDRYVWHYDARGFVVAIDVDHGADGSVQWMFQLTYDDVGRLVAQRFDDDADGVADFWDAWRYDDGGVATHRAGNADGREWVCDVEPGSCPERCPRGGVEGLCTPTEDCAETCAEL
ncbi:MAG: hypothetical protein H6710_25015 [Myxococcales bacterium]|nr:hypothetical protein [Myxococcales bacterium]